MNQDGLPPIKMGDKYFNERVTQKFMKVLKLPDEIVTNESDDELLMSFINQSFNQLMNIFLD